MRYIHEDGDHRRVISAVLAFYDESSKDDNIEEWAASPDDTPFTNTLTFVSLMSKVASIMDFRKSEDDDNTPMKNALLSETGIEYVIEGDDTENYLHRACFEKYIKRAGIGACVCISRNDDEASKRLTDLNLVLSEDEQKEGEECPESNQEDSAQEDLLEIDLPGIA